MNNYIKPVTASVIMASTDLKIAKMIGGYILVKETWDRSELPIRVEKIRQKISPEIIKKKTNKLSKTPYKIYNKIKDCNNMDIILASTLIGVGVLKCL